MSQPTAELLSAPSASSPQIVPPARPRWAAGALVLYVAIALAMLSPFAEWTNFRGVGDLYAVVGSIVEARSALREGQFPIRVPPHQLQNTRYPIFQFYGNFPYTAGGLIYSWLPVNEYTAWKIAALVSMVCGAFYACRCAMQFTRRPAPSVLAGVAFMASPYMFADLSARGAFTELVAFNLTPVALFYAWRSFVSPRPVYIFRSALAWALLGMSHNITYMYGVLFIGAFFLSFFNFNVKYLKRLLRVAAGGLLHVPLVLWYVAPQFAVLKSLAISRQHAKPMYWASLTTLGNLLRPLAFTPASSTTANLALQVGLPLMIAIAAAMVAAALPRCPRRLRALILRMLPLAAAAFFMVWSPVNFWAKLPELLRFVQFPYRLFIFLVLFGSLLGACGLAVLLPRRGQRAAAAVFLLLAGCTASTYLPHDKPFNADVVEKQRVDPKMGGLEDYLLATQVAAESSSYHSGINLAGPEFGLTEDGYLLRATTVEVPSPQSAEFLEIEGELPSENTKGVEFWTVIDKRTWGHAKVMPGPFKLSFPIVYPPGGRVIELTLDALAPGNKSVPAKLNRVRFSPAIQQPGEMPLLAAAAVKKQMKLGRSARLTLSLSQPTLLELPVIYYPGLLRVRDDGRAIPYGNLGRYVAVQLGPGTHHVDVKFVGVFWANAVSAVGWLVVSAGLLMPLWRRRGNAACRLRGRRRRSGFTPLQGVAASLLILGGGAAVQGYPLVAKFFDGSIRVKAESDSVARPEQAAQLAFDGDPGTEWSAKGSLPCTLTVTPNHAAELTKIELDARQTALYETWGRVRLVLYRRGEKVFERDVRFPAAAKEPTQTIDLPQTKTDKIEFHFSEPVTETFTGAHLEARQVSPGYREIRFTWRH